MLQRLIEEHGFAIIPNVLGSSNVEQLLANLDKTPLPHGRAGLRHALRHPGIDALAKDSRLLDIAREIMGGPAFPFRATVFDKSPTSNWLVVWHQDTALPLKERREAPGWGPWSVKEGVIYAHAPASALRDVLALRVHLDDSTLQNGPFAFCPGLTKMASLVTMPFTNWQQAYLLWIA